MDINLDGYVLTEIHGEIKEKYHIQNKNGLNLQAEEKTLVFNSEEEADDFIKNILKEPTTISVKTFISFYDKGALLVTKK